MFHVPAHKQIAPAAAPAQVEIAPDRWQATLTNGVRQFTKTVLAYCEADARCQFELEHPYARIVSLVEIPESPFTARRAFHQGRVEWLGRTGCTGGEIARVLAFCARQRDFDACVDHLRPEGNAIDLLFGVLDAPQWVPVFGGTSVCVNVPEQLFAPHTLREHLYAH